MRNRINRLPSAPVLRSGARVAYSVQWLKSTGLEHSAAAHARGTVRGFQRIGAEMVLALIDWDKADMPEKVNTRNLALVGPNPRFAAC